MWWGNKDNEVKAPASDPNAPPPLMFNPSNTGPTFKSKSSRNPLSRPKRPSGSTGPKINQPLQSPTGQQPQSPMSNPQSPISPLSPTTKQNFNNFPNFHGSETNVKPPEQPVAAFPETVPSDPAIPQVNQYLSNHHEYGNSNTHSEPQEDIDNGYVADDGGGTMSAFFGGDDDDVYSPQDYSPEQAEQPATQNPEENRTSYGDYENEEQFNFAYYQHYGQNPPPEQWIAYKQQWEDYYQSLQNNQEQAEYNQEQIQSSEPEQTHQMNNQVEEQQYDERYNQQAQYQQYQEYDNQQQNYQQSHHEQQHQNFEDNQNIPQHLPLEGDHQQPESLSSPPQHQPPPQQLQSPREPLQQRQDHQQHQPQLQSPRESDHQLQQQQFEQQQQQFEQQQQHPPQVLQSPREQQQHHQQQQQQQQHQPQHFEQQHHHQPEQQPLANNFSSVPPLSDNFPSMNPAVEYPLSPPSENVAREQVTSSAAHSDFFNSFAGPTQHSVIDNPSVDYSQPAAGVTQPPSQQLPVQQSDNVFDSHKNNLSPFDFPQVSHDKHPSPVNPDNQYQKERDSTTPLWDKKDLVIPKHDGIIDENPILSPPNSFEMPPIFPAEMTRSRNSSSTTSRTVSEQPLTNRTRNSSSTSRSQKSSGDPRDPRSRTTSSTSFKNEPSLEHVEPPPQFNDFSTNPVPPPSTFSNYSPSAFVPPRKISNPPTQENTNLPPPINNTNLTQPTNQSFGNPPPQQSSKTYPNVVPNVVPTNHLEEQHRPQENTIEPPRKVEAPPAIPLMRPPTKSNYPPTNPPTNRPAMPHPPNFKNMPPPLSNSQILTNTSQKVRDGVLMPPPNNAYEHINISKRRPDSNPLPAKPAAAPLSYTNLPVNFARPMNTSRPSSRSSDDTIARLRKLYEDNKIMKRATPDSIDLNTSEGFGNPLMNSTTNNSNKPLKSMSMKSLRDSGSMHSAASIIAQQEAYENVMLRKPPNESLAYENHELLGQKKPSLPPKPIPSLPPRPTRGNKNADTRSSSAHGNYGHRRNNSQGSGSSFKSDTRKYNDTHSEHNRSSGDDRRYDDQGRAYNPREREYYGRASGYNDYDRYRREQYERYRQEELSRRRGYHPDEYYGRDGRYESRGYGPAPQRNYPAYSGYRQGYGYERDRGYYYHDRSDALSIPRTESVRSDPISNETEDPVESSDPCADQETTADTTDTDPLVSEQLVSEQIEEDSVEDSCDSPVEETEEVEDTTTALADMFTAPYLYTRYHARTQCIAPNRMVCVVPGDDNDDGPPPKLELIDFKLLYWQEQKELEQYPGPFIKGETPKRDVMSYCRKQAAGLRQAQCKEEGRVLLWELLGLLCKQNGVVIGTDVAEILLQDQNQLMSASAESVSRDSVDDNVHCFIGSSGSSVASYTEEEKTTDQEKTEAVDKIRECLYEGQRKEALEVSVKYQLWDVALMIGTTLSSDVMTDTMQRFANSLHRDDPLKSFHQLVAGTEPTACSSTTNWRRHLAIVLSNQSDKYDPNFNYVLTMANTLASEGMVYASHVCCLMAGCKLTSVLDKTSPIALLGFDHTKTELHNLPYTAIQLTEIYEFAKSLGGESCIVPYQAVKLHYAKEVAKVGQIRKSLQYLQQISNNINIAPKSYRARFIQRVYDECLKMLYLDNSQMKEMPEWTEKLKETLNFRNLGISNRSTAYSSRVATPEIQRVAQYLLHQQKQNKQVPNILSAATSNQSSVAEPDTQQQIATQQQSAAAQQHHELEANGFVYDGQVYRHHMYQGYVYYEGEWYPDPNYSEQPPVEQAQPQTAEHLTAESLPTSHDPQQPAAAAVGYQQQYPAQDTGYTQPPETEYQAGYQGQDQTQYQSVDQAQYQALDQGGYQAQQETLYQQEHGTGEDGNALSESQHSTEYEPPKLYGSYNDTSQPRERLDTLVQEDEVEHDGGPPEEGAEPAEESVEPAPAPAPLTFFNPASFGGTGSNNLLTGGSSLLAPISAPDTATLTDGPLSDDEIKTPTNDLPEDNLDEVDEDSLYSKKKPKTGDKVSSVKKEDNVKKSQSSEGFFERLNPFKRSNNMNLPDDSKPTIYWDDNLGKYVDTTRDSDSEEEAPPPPTSLPCSSKSSIVSSQLRTVSGLSDDKIMSAPSSPGGTFRRKAGRGRLANRYIDVMGAGGGMKKSATSPKLG